MKLTDICRLVLRACELMHIFAYQTKTKYNSSPVHIRRHPTKHIHQGNQETRIYVPLPIAEVMSV